MEPQPKNLNPESLNLDMLPPHLQPIVRQFSKDPVALLKYKPYDELKEMLDSFKCFQKIEDPLLARKVQLIIISIHTRIKVYNQMNLPLQHSTLSQKQSQKYFKLFQANKKGNQEIAPGQQFSYRNLVNDIFVYNTEKFKKFKQIRVYNSSDDPYHSYLTYENQKNNIRIVDNWGRICLPDEQIQPRLSQSRKFHLLLRRWNIKP